MSHNKRLRKISKSTMYSRLPRNRPHFCLHCPLWWPLTTRYYLSSHLLNSMKLKIEFLSCTHCYVAYDYSIEMIYDYGISRCSRQQKWDSGLINLCPCALWCLLGDTWLLFAEPQLWALKTHSWHHGVQYNKGHGKAKWGSERDVLRAATGTTELEEQRTVLEDDSLRDGS